MSSLTRAKLQQAKCLVKESGLDAWLTFVRETSGHADPVLPLILEGGLTWASALIVTASGECVAVVGNYDADPLLASGDWDEVVPYIQDIREPLLKVLGAKLPPNARIAVNYSETDDKADGLTHGMWLKLRHILADTPFAESLETAEGFVGSLRALKTPEEIARMLRAVEETQRLFQEIATFARQGVSERQVYDMVHANMRQRGLGFSWDPTGNPIVNSGPHSMIGHGVPSDEIRLEQGHIFHVDLGVLADGYASDLQRSWFVGTSIPSDVSTAFNAVRSAIQAGLAVLRPGARGVDVDAAARASLVATGYPEYLHAFGHQVGRMAHDGGAILGPAWPRYGSSPFQPLQSGMVFTVELGVTLEDRGYLGLEEMLQLTDDGWQWLSTPQTEIWTIP